MLSLPMLLLTAAAQGGPPAWEALERRGATVSEIRIIREDVFDPANKPEEDNLVGRLGNHLHAITRENVVRRALLFHEGEKVNARHIHETERYLRSLVFLKDAEIDPEELPDGTVRARVRLHDAWTLKGTLSFKLVGGQQTRGFGLLDQNLLGTGKTLAFNYQHDPVRTTETLTWVDPQVLGSAWTMVASYQKLSDGSTRLLDLRRPYRSLDTPWAAALTVQSAGSTLTMYDRGGGIYAAHDQMDSLAAAWSWAAAGSGAEVWRPGFQLVSYEARYGPLAVLADPAGLPAPDLRHRRLQGPALTLNIVQDGYRVYRNLSGMDNPEDYNLGWSGTVVAGAYLASWSSTENAPFAAAALSKGWGSGPGLLLASVSASGRHGPAGFEDTLANLTAVGYWKETEHEITAARLALDRARRPDPEDVYYAGAFQGLRGYGNWLHPGDGRWLMTVEQRMLTDYRWLGIFRLGFVAFADAGGIRRLDGSGWTPAYADAGAGLRLGDLKSSLGKVILITAAAPLVREPGQRGWQFAIGNITQF